MSAHDHKSDYRLKNTGALSQAGKYSAVIGAVGALLAIGGFATDPHRFGYSYLFAVMCVLTLVFGAMFLVIAQHITAGHWGVSTRRIAEILMAGAPVVAILALPLIVGVATGKLDLYSEWAGASHGDHAAAHGDEHSSAPALFGAATAHADTGAHGDAEVHEHTPQEQHLHHSLIAKKAGWLNVPFWVGRALFYLISLSLIAAFYFRSSLKQDETKDPQITVRVKNASAVMAIIFGLVLTFLAFDWLMALEAAWYSTIYGVIIFAGSATSCLALMIVIGLALAKGGHVGDAINIEHFHDLSRLMFGFICFWAYVGFSQWMLIWYAGIPEEAVWYAKRWEGGWQWVSVLLVLGHWVIPCFVLMSRMFKRNLAVLSFMCFWLLAFHVVDMFWFIFPHATETPSLQVSWIDFGCLMFTGGVFFAFVFAALKRLPLVPVGDPRLERSIHLHQSY